MNLVEAIRRANAAREPEDSVRLRIACAGAVVVGIAACAAQNEISHIAALGASVLVVCGMTFSYATRKNPPGWVKVLVAGGALLALLWFFEQVSGRAVSDITTVENPLTVLFAWIQVAHSFHVPSRRDLLFSLAGATGLMAVAAAQAVDLGYTPYAIAWAGFTLWGLLELWVSASGGGRVSPTALGTAFGCLAAVGILVFLLLPAPSVAVRIDFQSRAGGGGAISSPGALAGDSGSPAQLSRRGSPAGRTHVGGYLGFAGSLDTALRGKLSKAVVMRVRAERPSYWVGETFDEWDGQSWNQSQGQQPPKLIGDGSPFVLPPQKGGLAEGTSDLQTFFVVSSTADLVFHAETAQEVWFPASSVFYSEDGTIVSPLAMGRGSIYSVESTVSSRRPADLRRAGLRLPDPSLSSMYTQLPHPYPQVAALARTITARYTNTYDKVQALINWMGANTRYSTDIPPLPPGADTVDDFLFGTRVGFCEQISTSLAVMLRTLSIPVRETVGYVPGPYNPITDLYDVRAEDAHAWVEVWFPGAGWQSFDPTASVPLANPSPGATALADLGRAFGRIPVIPVGVIAGSAAALFALARWRRSRPSTWAESVARRIEAAGRRAGRRRRPDETIAEYAAILDGPDAEGVWSQLAAAVQASTYGRDDLPEHRRRELLSQARRARVDRRLVASGVSAREEADSFTDR